MRVLVAVLIATASFGGGSLAMAGDEKPVDWKKHIANSYAHYEEQKWGSPADMHLISLFHCGKERTLNFVERGPEDTFGVFLNSKVVAFPNAKVSVYELLDSGALERLTGCWQGNLPMAHVEVGTKLVVMSGLCRATGYWRYDVDDFLRMVEAAGLKPKNI